MKYDIIIIGAGITGLASALKIKENRPELKVLIVEKEKSIAMHQTGNNSGVIHSGIYYKPGSLKALNCLKGYKMLLEFCRNENVEFELCGKLIVAAQPAELPGLDALFQRGMENGLDGIKKISGNEIKNYEPAVEGIAAIHLPQTGIIDYKAVCDKYLQIFTTRFGGGIVYNNKVKGIEIKTNETIVKTDDGAYICSLAVNCCGLFSDRVAKFTTSSLDVRIIPFRGEYYTLTKESSSMVRNLIYPVPDPAFPFLGVHFTRRIDGKVEAGPNAVFSFKREGYRKTSFSLYDAYESFAWKGFRKVMFKYMGTGIGEYYRSFNKYAFTKALRKLIPSITVKDIAPGGAGVRAQACTITGSLADDFIIYEKKGIVNVCNAPSPAATASLAIGESVAAKALVQI